MAPVKKVIQCAVQSIDCMIALNITSETTGKQLIEMIFKQCGIYEKHWFGLMYHDIKGNRRWLDMEKKVNLKDVEPFPETSAHFRFTIKYFPESMRVELIQDEVKVLFFKYELSRLVTDPDVEIVPEHRVLCAVAYCCLVAHEHENMTPEKVARKKFDRLIPVRVLKNFDLTKKDWLDAITSSLEIAKSQYYTDTLQQALDVMEQAPMHGISYYEIRNKNNTDLLLGVDCYGLTIYKPEDRVNPRVAFMWQEVHSVSYIGKAFNIKPVAKDDPPLVIYTRSVTQNDEILSLIAGNHMNYLRRRQGDAQLDIEEKQAKSAQEVHNAEKKRFETQKEANIQYDNKLNGILNADTDKKEKEKELENEFNKTKELMEKQIQEAKRTAEEEKKKKALAEKETEELRKRAEEMEKKLLHEQSAKDAMALLEAERASQDKLRQQEIEQLNQQLKALELKHQEELNRIKNAEKEFHTIKKAEAPASPQTSATQRTSTASTASATQRSSIASTAASATPIAPAAATLVKKPVTYEQVKKETNFALKSTLSKFSTLVREKTKALDSTAAQVQIYNQSGVTKFETLKRLRKNNTKARIDEFEAF